MRGTGQTLRLLRHGDTDRLRELVQRMEPVLHLLVIIIEFLLMARCWRRLVLLPGLQG